MREPPVKFPIKDVPLVILISLAVKGYKFKIPEGYLAMNSGDTGLILYPSMRNKESFVKKVSLETLLKATEVSPQTRVDAWFYNIPEGGILCHCGYSGDLELYISLVKQFNIFDKCPFDGFEIAIPLSAAEIEGFLPFAKALYSEE